MQTKRQESWVRWGGQTAGRVLLCSALFVALCAGQAGSRPLYDPPARAPYQVRGQTIRPEVDAYASEGSVQEQGRTHWQLETRLSRRGFYRLWSRPLAMEGSQQAEAWYDAGADQTVLRVSGPTTTGKAQQVWVMTGKLRHGDVLSADYWLSAEYWLSVD